MSLDTPSKKISLLSPTAIGTAKQHYDHVILPDEEILLEYKSIRDAFILTDRKAILIDTQGITGKKKEVLVIPYSKITAFSTETAGTLDLSAEVKIWASGIGFVELTFTMNFTNMKEIAQLLSQHVR